jgi:hypothetical protein
MGRARVPARRESVPEANGAFSSLIREGYGLREQSGSCRTRTRSLPALDPAMLTERFRVLAIVVVKSSPFL